VQTAHEKTGCILCAAYQGRSGGDSLVVHAGRENFVIVNLYPYTSGHVMVAPVRHVGTLAEATSAELGEMMELARRAEGALAAAYNAQGFNLGMNLGKAAGAGVEGHLHLHVVPRWGGDTNFMSTIGEARVLPEDLQTTRRKLAPHFGA
jgi:ATP adenylyltransferase